ncbi:MAG: Ni/Fe hydrogenase subunit alpha [Acidobacteriia bacterium]|nr:Ni/Fe hydrogenase subunit alpha [Terriglobia bacterium]
MARTIHVDYLARVEGEGALTIRFKGDQPKDVELRIFEPPRFFEAFLRGRSYHEAPDITARICGICPVAYQMSACRAMEDLLGIEVEGPVRELRRLLYCGEWIESHVLHMFMLHLPDFLGYPDAIELARDHPEAVMHGLRMKKAGNAIVSMVGGREIHPINVRVGGFFRAPSRAQLRQLLPELEWSRRAMREAAVFMAGLKFPEFERDYEFIALRHESEYAIYDGRIVSSKGLDIPVSEFDTRFEEEHVARSNALHSRIKGRGAYLVGPLARINLNFEHLSVAARETAEVIGLRVPCLNPFKSLLARAVETVHAFAEAIAIIEAYEPPEQPRLAHAVRAGTGRGATEAPRGILYHRYKTDGEGIIEDAKIVPPTSQNQLCIEEDLFTIAPRLATMPAAEATWLAEQSVRNYDPCISCATHFLRLRIDRE